MQVLQISQLVYGGHLQLLETTAWGNILAFLKLNWRPTLCGGRRKTSNVCEQKSMGDVLENSIYCCYLGRSEIIWKYWHAFIDYEFHAVLVMVLRIPGRMVIYRVFRFTREEFSFEMLNSSRKIFINTSISILTSSKVMTLGYNNLMQMHFLIFEKLLIIRFWCGHELFQ